MDGIRFMFSPDSPSGGAAPIEVTEPMFESGIEIDEVEEETGPSKDDLLKEFNELKAQNEELRTKAEQSAALSQSFNQFGDRLEKVVTRPTPAPVIQQKEPGETYEQFKERINRSYLEDPVAAMTEFNSRQNSGVFQTLAEQNLRLQRRLAYMEASDRDFIKKHEDEIEAEMQNVPIEIQLRDPHSVNRAIDSVRARHMDEIVSERLQAELTKLGITPGSPPAGGAGAARAPVGASEAPVVSGAAPASASSARRVQITPAKKGRIMNQMRMEGIPAEKYQDYVGWLVEDGEFDKI